MPRTLTLALSLIATIATLAPAAPEAPARTLPRKPLLGVRFAPVEVPGAGVGAVIPGTTASALGLLSGDVMVKIGDTDITDPAAAMDALRPLRSGDPVRVTVVRGDSRVTLEGEMKPRPGETREGSETLYGAVDLDGKLLRTILTRPEGDGPFPAFYLIQGLGPASVDYPYGDTAPYRRLVDAFASRGYVTLRVQKPGVGDSEGGPSAEVDFDTETRGFLAGLRMLRSLDFVDASNVYVFGHSMGGVMGPIIAREEPVRGMIVFGTTALTWAEYELENNRRQAELAGADDAQTDEMLRRRTAFFKALYFDDKTLAEALAEHPEMREAFPDETLMYGKTPQFFVQLANLNIAAVWQRYPGRVLALWGRGDFVSGPRDHRTLVNYVNRKHPGMAEYRAVPGIDHFFLRAANQLESFRNMAGARGGEFNAEIVRLAVEWVEKERARPIEKR